MGANFQVQQLKLLSFIEFLTRNLLFIPKYNCKFSKTMLSHQNNVIFKVFPVIFYTNFVTVIIAKTYSGSLNKYGGLKQHGFTI